MEKIIAQQKKLFQQNDSYEAASQHDMNETIESQARTLNREGKRATLHTALL